MTGARGEGIRNGKTTALRDKGRSFFAKMGVIILG